MTVLWVDPGNGAAGDMLLAALLDAGAELAVVRAGLARLRVEPVELSMDPVRRHGLRAAHVTVRAPETRTHRGLSDVLGVIGSAGLPEPVTAFAGAVFGRLARAEARVHGCGVEEVHFHEVGALDAIADVVGCALALHDLELLTATTRLVAPIAVGSGTVRAAHGVLPVPAPAVLELLAESGAPVRAHPAQFELCTPTGAALLTTLATGWGPAPSCTVRAVGVGAGTADPAGHPNVLRVLIGTSPTGVATAARAAGTGSPAGVGAAEVVAVGAGTAGVGAGAGGVGAGGVGTAGAGADWAQVELSQIETTVDDLDPRIWPDLLEKLRAAGAADAWCTPVLMRKGRPGQVLSVLVDADRVDLVCRLIFEQTTTLGVRIIPVARRFLPRDQVTLAMAGGEVRVKRGYLGGRVITEQPEYDDVLAVATRSGAPIAEILVQVRRQLDETTPLGIDQPE